MTLFLLFSCREPDSNESQKKAVENSKVRKVEIVTYKETTIPIFLKELVENHQREFEIVDSSTYKRFCLSNEIFPSDSNNLQKYLTLSILHRLFTCKNATDGSRGEILNVPYFWNWVNPNPRSEITLLENKQKLGEIKPPKEFSKYDSYANIDRTPYLFLSELFLDNPKYYSNSCDTFSTFGWCSEREMAFVCTMDFLNYNGKVMAEGNHSWSEFIVPLQSINKGEKNFKVKVDNTFDEIEWEEITKSDKINWGEYLGNAPQANWYNQQAHSGIEKEKIKKFLISKSAMSRIENSIVKYLIKKLE